MKRWHLESMLSRHVEKLDVAGLVVTVVAVGVFLVSLGLWIGARR